LDYHLYLFDIMAYVLAAAAAAPMMIRCCDVCKSCCLCMVLCKSCLYVWCSLEDVEERGRILFFFRILEYIYEMIMN
jgi:hypothetical protein